MMARARLHQFTKLIRKPNEIFNKILWILCLAAVRLFVAFLSFFVVYELFFCVFRFEWLLRSIQWVFIAVQPSVGNNNVNWVRNNYYQVKYKFDECHKESLGYGKRAVIWTKTMSNWRGGRCVQKRKTSLLEFNWILEFMFIFIESLALTQSMPSFGKKYFLRI